jgi:hypothetical protein
VRGANLIADRFSNLEWESGPEANALVLLGLCKAIARIYSQPCVLQVEGMEYTPDVLAFTRDERRIWIEVKADASQIDAETKHKLGLVNALIRSVGDTFIVLDNSVLADESPVVDNCRYLSRWLDLASSDDGSERWPAATYGELIDRHGGDRVNAALASRAYFFDLSQPLGRNTVVTPSRAGEADELAFLYT